MKHLNAYIHDQLQTRYPPEEIRGITRLLLTAICGLSPAQQICCKDKKIPENEKKQLYAIIARLKKMEPLQYILCETQFYSLPMKVNPSVLIPRPETEELVDMIIRSSFVKSYESRPPLRILDIGTGSGCIAIALAKHIPHSTVTAIDISETALQTAKENAQLNNTPIRFQQADILDTKKTVSLFPEPFDLIVSNPPYVKEEEKETMSANVLNYEPPIALYVPNDTPIRYYTAIADFALQKSVPQGMIFLEINPLCDTLIYNMLQEKKFSPPAIIRDLSGKNRYILTINH